MTAQKGLVNEDRYKDCSAATRWTQTCTGRIDAIQSAYSMPDELQHGGPGTRPDRHGRQVGLI